MSRFDPKEPPKPVQGPESNQAREGGVRVIVHDRPARTPSWQEPEPPQRVRDAIIVPERQSAADRDAFIASLDAKWGGLIEKELSRRKDVAQASRPDVHQAVLMILCRHYEKEKKAGRPPVPDNEPAFLRKVIENEVKNHARKKAKRPRIEPGAEVDEAPDAGLDPERAVLLAELREKLGRYRKELTPEEEEVFEAREVDLMSFEMIAAAVGRPLVTVYNQHTRAIEKLKDLARASERNAALGRGASKHG
jgi:RNA polymerase sigma factor (sigma-70 family)